MKTREFLSRGRCTRLLLVFSLKELSVLQLPWRAEIRVRHPPRRLVLDVSSRDVSSGDLNVSALSHGSEPDGIHQP